MKKDLAIKIEALFLQYNRFLYSIAYKILNEHQLAQDAVQMTFVKVIDNIKAIDEQNSSKTKAFMVIICRNIAINLYNKRKFNPSLMLDEIDNSIPDYSYNPDYQIISLESLAELKTKIKMLYQPYADIIALKYIFGYSEKEITKILDITEQNVRVRLHRAKTSLMKIINNGDEMK